MDILFIGKRFYTNRDALKERFGRIYQLPSHWAKEQNTVELWLVDYHSKEKHAYVENTLKIASTPALSIAFLWQLIKTLIGKRPTHVVASGDCYIGLLGYFLSVLLRSKFSFDIYDKYDEFKGYRRLAFFDPLTFLINNSNSLIFASKALLAATTHKNKILAPNGVDTALFRPLNKASSRDALSLPQSPIYIGYFGSMEPERGVQDLIDAIHLIRTTTPHVELLLAGEKPDTLNIDALGINYLGNIPFAKIPLALNACEVLVLPYRNSAFLDMASSCKIAEYMAVEIPIVATRTPNILKNFATQTAILETIMPPPGEVDALAKSIQIQLEQRVVVTPETGMTWKEIAENTLRQLADNDPL